MQLREALEGQGLRVWADSRNLRGGAKLAPEIERAIEDARCCLRNCKLQIADCRLGCVVRDT
jgi:hypothetical protein